MSESLTHEQEHAVSRRAEPLLLSAGAGSGKTSVLVERFVRAVLDDGVAPSRILAITFTDRAAGELRERVRARLLELGGRQAARDTEAAFVSTFHGFCARLLRGHALLAGLDPDFAVLEEGLAAWLRERAFRSALERLLAGGERDALDVVAAYGVDGVQAMLLGVYADLRSRGMRAPGLPLPAEAQPEAVDRDARAALVVLDRLLRGFGEDYQALKSARAAVDFDDLELLAAELLGRQRGVREAWAERFQLLMVDEFQDTNPRQMGILRSLARENLFTVGDELQSIYGFRHAQVELFRERRAELEVVQRSLTLTHNFRSTAPLLEFVNALFAARMPAAFTPLVAGRGGEGAGEPAAEPRVELLLTAKSGWEGELARAVSAGLPHATVWRQAEARALAARVSELVHAGEAEPGDVAVLLRARGDIEVYERALQLHGLPTIAMVGSFWDRLHTRDMLSYLAVLANPLQESALYETLASPLAGVRSDGLALIAEASREAGVGVWQTILAISGSGGPAAPALERLAAGDRERLVRFGELLAREREGMPNRSIAQLIERVLVATGYREYVLGLDWGERRLANIHKLLRLARRFEAAEGRDLRGFLEHAGRMQEETTAAEPDAPVDSVEPGAIRLMTIHAAKGLEFGVVCVADLGRSPGGRPSRLLVDGERVGLSLQRLDGAKAVPALDYDELRAQRRRAEVEEEDRVLYVAMTRARERLLLSGAIELAALPPEKEGSPSIVWLARALAGSLPAPLDGGPAVCDVEYGEGVVRGRVRCRLHSPGNTWVREPPATAGAAPVSAPGETPLAAGEPVVAPERVAAGEPVAAPEPVAAGEPAGPEPAEPAAAEPPTGETRGQGGAEPMSTLSYTSVSLLERCGYRYYLERVLGLAEDRSAARRQSSQRGLEARQRGTLVHALLERLDFASARAPQAREVARAGRDLGLAVTAGEAGEIAELLRVALASPTAAAVATAGSVRRELSFAFSLGAGGPLVTGVIDLLASEPGGGALVLDHKSDRVGEEEDLEGLVEREYGLQRLIYALAVLRDGAPWVRIVHWFLARPNEPVGVRFEQSERESLLAQLCERVARARAGGFLVSANPHRGLCLTCPGRSALCSWSEAHTLREDPGGEGEASGQLTLAP